MKNSERFLAAFNRITFTLRKIVKAKEFMPFYRLVDFAKKKSPLVRKYEDELRSFADLRNVIVHYRVSEDFVIAEPHTQVVERIEYIDELLADPGLVGQVFRKKVVAFQTSDSLKDVLELFRNGNIRNFLFTRGGIFKGSSRRWHYELVGGCGEPKDFGLRHANDQRNFELRKKAGQL